MNKIGYDPKRDNEKIVYVIILIIVAIFVLNMKNIYNFTVKLRTGQLFQKETVAEQPVDSDGDSSEETEEVYEIVEPIGSNSTICKKSIVDVSGEKETTISLYYTNGELKSIVEENQYSGLSDEYTNYIYSERNKYNTRKADNLELIGFSVVVDLSANNYLKTSTVIDLSKLDLTKVQISDSDGLEMYGSYNQDIDEVKELYINQGYECEE